MEFIIPFILILANRMRDGWITEIFTSGPIYNFFTKNSQAGRFLWAIPFAIILVILVHFTPWYNNYLYAVYLTLAAFGGACCAAWGDYNHPPWTLSKLSDLTIQGLIFTGIPGIVAALGDYPHNLWLGIVVILSGALIVPAYVLGWEIPGKWNGTPWGSVIFGFCIGAAICIYKFIGIL